MKFKIGDKVKHEIYGIGNVVYVDENDAYLPFTVEFENSYSDLHNLGTCKAPEVKYGHGYWCSEGNLELLTREPQNLIPEIAKMLGVEIGEEFNVLDKQNNIITKCSFEYFNEINKGNELCFVMLDNGFQYTDVFYFLASGQYYIQKLPKKPQLTEVERIILENLPKKYKWITRDKDGLYCHENKPRRTDRNVWIDSKYALTENLIYEHLFGFIKFEDEEPYNIEELLRGE